MTITEHKLRIENERYKKALQKICHGYAVHTNAAQWAETALNPSPQPPVTLADILTALGPNKGDYLNPSLEIFFDGSATIHLKMGKMRAFTTVQQALDFCKEEA